MKQQAAAVLRERADSVLPIVHIAAASLRFGPILAVLRRRLGDIMRKYD